MCEVSIQGVAAFDHGEVPRRAWFRLLCSELPDKCLQLAACKSAKLRRCTAHRSSAEAHILSCLSHRSCRIAFWLSRRKKARHACCSVAPKHQALAVQHAAQAGLSAQPEAVMSLPGAPHYWIVRIDEHGVQDWKYHGASPPVTCRIGSSHAARPCATKTSRKKSRALCTTRNQKWKRWQQLGLRSMPSAAAVSEWADPVIRDAQVYVNFPRFQRVKILMGILESSLLPPVDNHVVWGSKARRTVKQLVKALARMLSAPWRLLLQDVLLAHVWHVGACQRLNVSVFVDMLERMLSTLELE